MKTSKQIDEVPRNEWQGKFCVMRETEPRKSMKFSRLHDDVLSATEEAQRMNGEHPEARYLVMKVVTVVGF